MDWSRFDGIGEMSRCKQVVQGVRLREITSWICDGEEGCSGGLQGRDVVLVNPSRLKYSSHILLLSPITIRHESFGTPFHQYHPDRV